MCNTLQERKIDKFMMIEGDQNQVNLINEEGENIAMHNEINPIEGQEESEESLVNNWLLLYIMILTLNLYLNFIFIALYTFSIIFDDVGMKNIVSYSCNILIRWCLAVAFTLMCFKEILKKKKLRFHTHFVKSAIINMQFINIILIIAPLFTIIFNSDFHSDKGIKYFCINLIDLLVNGILTTLLAFVKVV